MWTIMKLNLFLETMKLYLLAHDVVSFRLVEFGKESPNKLVFETYDANNKLTMKSFYLDIQDNQLILLDENHKDCLEDENEQLLKDIQTLLDNCKWLAV